MVPVHDLPAEMSPVAPLVDRLQQFSVEFTAVVDDVLGTDYASNPQLCAVAALARSGSRTTRQLAEESGMTRRTTTKLVKLLQAGGVVDSSRDPTDRRAVLVTPTDAGRAVFERLGVRLDAFFRSAAPLAGQIVEDIESVVSATGDGDETAGKGRTVDPLVLLEEVARTGIEIDRAYRRLAGSKHVEGRQRLALLVCANWESVRPGDLAQALELSSGGVTHLLDNLERLGLVRRRYGSLDDRRGAEITISARGRATINALYQAVQDVGPRLHAVFSTVSDYDR